MSKKEKKTKPIPSAEGFYMTKLQDDGIEEYTHFKISMPLFTYTSIPNELVDNSEAMKHVLQDAITTLIYETEGVILKYKIEKSKRGEK